MTRREYALSMHEVAGIKARAQRAHRNLSEVEQAKLRNLDRQQRRYEDKKPDSAGRILRAFVRFH